MKKETYNEIKNYKIFFEDLPLFETTGIDGFVEYCKKETKT